MIMTSKGRPTFALRARLAFAGALCAWLAACASLPDDAPIVEQLDDETGLTIARLGRPLELYQQTVRRDAAARFAFLGPFETNQMGKREAFLWVALPVETAADALPVISIDGTDLPVGEGSRSAELAGLQESPYRNPTPWIATYYFRLDPTALDNLGAARGVSIRIVENTRGGPVDAQFDAQVADDPRLRDFAERY